ncbi:MAG: TraB/VirB10 family protein [Rhodospirillales bacterium]|nr:TraB/VirB10 family protein [Rhodospirillales bacterium]
MSARADRRPAGDANDADAVRRRQLLLFSVIAAVVLVAVAVWLGMGGGKTDAPQGGIDAGIVDPDAAEMVWTRRSEARLNKVEDALRRMEQEAGRLRTENEGLRTKLEAQTADALRNIDRQSAVIDELERRLQPQAQPGTAQGNAPADDPWFRGQAVAPQGGQPRPTAPVSTRMIETFELEGTPRSSVADPRTGPEMVADAVAKPVSAWLPAGAHAEAVVLAGVDASAGVSSQGDPRPVLMRITGPAWTAAEDGTAMQVDVDGCTVTGAAHGDLSSEKVYVRFRTMTCAGPVPGTVVETDVAGFVAGSGKTGVRGPVVSREGALVEKAFLAGVVSGLGQGVSQAFQPQAVATGTGAAVANTGLGDIGRAGLGAGASSAGQKVADYMIRRAEQYQPVVQLQAGTKVTLVFLEGARIDGRPRATGQAQSAQEGQ